MVNGLGQVFLKRVGSLSQEHFEQRLARGLYGNARSGRRDLWRSGNSCQHKQDNEVYLVHLPLWTWRLPSRPYFNG